MEEFREVKGYEGLYEVSNLGNLKSLARRYVLRDRLLNPKSPSSIYLEVNLSNKGIKKTHKVHKLVAIAFLGHTPNGFKGLIIDHIDNNPLNNRADNLQLITNRHNSSKDKKGGSSKYLGVTWCKSRNKWNATITIEGKTKNLGRFTDELEAAEAYIIELQKLYERI
tara:strand:- start:2 stop:502 length:501 start_codon:yes stop_codon:yes gene_type:complete